MKLKQLFKSLKECKKYRDTYRIEPGVEFEIDGRDWLFYLLPTIQVRPWCVRYPGEAIVAICWLNFAVGFGRWRSK